MKFLEQPLKIDVDGKYDLSNKKTNRSIWESADIHSEKSILRPPYKRYDSMPSKKRVDEMV